MPYETSINERNEILPFFHNAAGRRPYQPYCVTEASSRCQSPEATHQQPLRISYLAADHVWRKAHSESVGELVLDDVFVKSASSAHRQYYDLAVSHRTGKDSQSQHVPPNELFQSGNTSLVNTDHITQPVTPRGSHSLASGSRTECHGALSHPRVRQSGFWYLAASRQSGRKLLPWHSDDVRIDHHPLPSVSEEASPNSRTDEIGGGEQDEIDSVGDRGQNLTQPHLSTSSELADIGEQSLLLDRYCAIDTQPPQELTIHSTDDYEIPEHNILSAAEPEYHESTTPLLSTSTQEPSRSTQTSNIIAEHAQSPSLDSLYLTRNQPPQNHEDQKAPRRTKPLHPNFRYQFSQPPSRPQDLPHSTTPHENTQHASIPHTASYNPMPSTTDLLSGPRPPPWVSYDALELRREQRSGARERSHRCTYRRQDEIVSQMVSVDLRAANALRSDAVRREVDEYRRQVLSVYPELELDRELVTERGWCCGVM